MKLQEIIKDSEYSLSLFNDRELKWLEKRIVEVEGKKGMEYKADCIIREKQVKLIPEEVIRQLYTYQLIHDYGYPEKLIRFEYPVKFGRETKRADIVIIDKDDNTAAYVIIEVKN